MKVKTRMTIEIVEHVSAVVVDTCQTWECAYSLRDGLQAHALASGYDLTERRYGVRWRSE